MKVLILSGASSIHTIRWVNALSRRNIKVILVSQHYPIEEIDNNVKVYIFKNYGSLGYYLLINKVKKIIEIEKPDLINAHYASGYGTTARLLNFHPYILSVWGSDIYDFPYKSFLHRGLINKNLLAADIIASTGNNMANQIKEICNDIAVKDIYITPFGVDLDNYKNNYFKERGNKIVIGTVKALKCVYGIDILIKAYNRVLEMRPDLKNILYLRVTGSGPEKENIIKLIKNLNLNDYVELVERVPHNEVPLALQDLDIYLALSRKESFGVAVIEAAAALKPIIVSDVGGLPEVITQNKTGIIVPNESFEDAALAIINLLEDPNKMKELAFSAKESIGNRYSWDNCVDIMINCFNNAINKDLVK